MIARMHAIAPSAPLAAAPLSIAPLWARVRAAFARAVAAIGAPAAIVALGLLPHALRRTIANRIALLEHIVRKLLLAEAGRLEAHPSSFRTRASAIRNPGASGRRLAVARAAKLDLARSETWPARFALAPPRDPRAVPEANAPRIRALWGATPNTQTQPSPPRAPRDESSAFRLARRLEALRRVLDDPRPHAARLARVLMRLRRRYPEAALRFAMATARTSTFGGDDPGLGVEAMATGFTGASAFSDSS